MRLPKGPWWRFLSRFIPLLVLLMWPWPGLAPSFSDAFTGICNAFAGVDVGWDSEVHFTPNYSPEHPWWVQVSVTNVLTGEALGFPLDLRTIAYLRIAMFVALALALPIWKTRRGLTAVGLGFTLLMVVNVSTVATILLQLLGMAHVVSLGPFTHSVLYVGILSLLSYPAMSFAIPGLIWLFTMYLADPAGGAGWLPKNGVR